MQLHVRRMARAMKGGGVSPASDPDEDREYLLERLQSLRTIVPVFAKELASVRRQVARLRQKNSKLVEQVRHLERLCVGRGGARHGELAVGAMSHPPPATPRPPAVKDRKGAADAQHADTLARLG